MSSRLHRKGSAVLICVAAGLSLSAASCSKAEQEKAGATPQTAAIGTTATILRDGVTFSADPNPIFTGDSKKPGITTLKWTTAVSRVQVRVGSPGGTLFAQAEGAGSATTGPWTTDGMVFYLQDGSASSPTDASATLATISIPVK